MKITVTGSLGNISKRLTEQLVQKGHEVTVVSSDADKANAIKRIGAIPAIGSVENTDFITNAFTGADAVYTMFPPNYNTDDMKSAIIKIAEVYAKAIKTSGVNYVVNLSAIGADMPEGNGPSSVLYHAENRLNQLEGINILHLRPGMFYTNQHGSVNMIKRMGFMGNNFDPSAVIAMTHPYDIGDAAAEALDSLSFTGKQLKYIVSDELTGTQLAAILGEAFNKPNLAWVVFEDEQLIQGIMQGGFSRHMAEKFAEMGRAIGKGDIWHDYRANQADAYGKLKFKDFAAQLSQIYKE